MSIQKKSEPSPSYSSPEFIPMGLEVGGISDIKYINTHASSKE